jgi:acyl-CoA thioester hydrolase
MTASRTFVRVRYAETDRMGYAYYGGYFAWFEVGRVEFLRERGIAYAELEDSGTLLPVAETSCRYLAPARYDDELEVETRVEEFGRSSVTFASRVLRRSDGAALAEGRTRLACVDRNGKPKRLPGELARALGGGSPANAVAEGGLT